MALTIVNDEAVGFKKALLESMGNFEDKSENVKLVYQHWDTLFIPYFEKASNLIIDNIDPDEFADLVSFLSCFILQSGDCGEWIDNCEFYPDFSGWSSSQTQAAISISYFSTAVFDRMESIKQFSLISDVDIEILDKMPTILLAYWIPFEVSCQILDWVDCIVNDCEEIFTASLTELSLKRLLMQKKKQLRECCIALDNVCAMIYELAMCNLLPRRAIAIPGVIGVATSVPSSSLDKKLGDNDGEEKSSVQTGTEVSKNPNGLPA